MTELRDYQQRAVAAVLQHWQSGRRRVCVVCPTGGGKSIIARAIAERSLRDGRHPIAIAHRLEIIDQLKSKLPGTDVVSIQGLVAGDTVPSHPVVIVDECHHLPSSEWGGLYLKLHDADIVGFTATPARGDGRGLSDYFDAIVVAASYSSLLSEDHLVPCRVFRPTESLGSDLAQDPLQAYLQRSAGRQAFVYCRDVEHAQKVAKAFCMADIAAWAITGDMPADQRDFALNAFRNGKVRVLTSVHVLTEGVDVPAVDTCILASGVSHAGAYLQKVGRVLRPYPGKEHALLLDLVGASHLYGLPTADREYSLDGRPIRVTGEPLKNCPQCGATIPAAENPCAECGFAFKPERRCLPRIWDLELAEAIAQADGDPALVSTLHKRVEFERLRKLCSDRRWTIGWAINNFKQLFGHEPHPQWIASLSAQEKEMNLALLQTQARSKGYKAGWVAWRYKSYFGTWPRRNFS